MSLLWALRLRWCCEPPANEDTDAMEGLEVGIKIEDNNKVISWEFECLVKKTSKSSSTKHQQHQWPKEGGGEKERRRDKPSSKV